jgi:spore coat protein U-like protein
MLLKAVSAAFAFAALAISPISALATTRTATFSVSVVVLNSCQTSASRTASTTDPVKITCSNATPYTVSTSAKQPVPAAGVADTADAQGQVHYSVLPDRSRAAHADPAIVTITY